MELEKPRPRFSDLLIDGVVEMQLIPNNAPGNDDQGDIGVSGWVWDLRGNSVFLRGFSPLILV